MEEYAPYFAVIAGPLMFAALWSFALFVSSALGGWWKLSRHFRARQSAQGEAFSMVSGRMRFFNYNFVLKIVLAPRGMYLSVLFLFRPFHPPLFIPWEAVRNVRRQRVLFSRYVVFDVYGQERLLTVRISEAVADSVLWRGAEPGRTAGA